MNFANRIRRAGVRVPPPARLVAGLALLALTGSFLMMLPGVGSSRPLQVNEAVFTAISALSVTGLTVIAPGRDLTVFGQIVLLALIQVGGVGFMVLAVLVYRLIGRQMSLEDRMALRDSLGLLSLTEIVVLTRRVFKVVLLIELIGAILLWLHWRAILPLSEWDVIRYALFHAVSAFCNAGFDLFSGLPQFPDGVPNDGITLTIFAILIVIGGLGIPVVADLISWPRARTLSLHTRLTLFIVLWLNLTGALSMFLAETLTAGTLTDVPVGQRFGLSLFQVISARTAGFSGVPHLEALSPGAHLTLIGLMFVGSAPASMGGGITTGTFLAMLISMWSYVRGFPAARALGRTIGQETVRRAGAVLTVSLVVVITATYLIAISHSDITLLEALFEVVSAFATCGLSLGITGSLTLFGQVVIMLVMFWGRLGALTVVAALAMPRRKTLVTYPDAQILIG
ncbi:MAG: potassium transporter TrkG [Anaerolineae bacterium]|nr:potassium transporter [Candidatus Roseilinea sp.]MDW8450096.1 potassium transporter TrkG [Anaerolineae bacterium]